MRFALVVVMVSSLVLAPASFPSFAEDGSDDVGRGLADLTDEVVTSTAEEWKAGLRPKSKTPEPVSNERMRRNHDRPPVRTFGDIVMSSDCAPDEARVEIIWIDPDTGEWTDYEGFRCLPRSQIQNDDGGGAPPGASAEAPARDSVAEAIPDRVVRTNPHPRGMTGMETWFWYDDDGDETTAPTTELTVAASVPEVSVTATAAISSYCWDVDGDGSDEVCTDAPGTEEHPAFTHVYESTGTYEVRLTVTWTGSFSVNGAPPVAFDPVQRTYSVDYEVIQVRSVLTG